MNKILHKAKVLCLVYYAYMLEYRAELLFWVLSGSLPFILMGVWIKAAQAGQFALRPLEFARYFLAAFLARQFTVIWVIWDFERDVVEGQLSNRLLQPIDPVWRYFAAHCAERLARAPFVGVLIALFFWLYPESFWVPSLASLLLFGLALLLSFCLRFLMQYTLAMFAFWIERATAIEQFWFLFFIFLSGLAAPLEVFPPLLREVTLWTPFPYIIYFPAAIVVGLPVDVLRGFLMMLGWGWVFFVCNRWLWRQGLKQYSGMGA
ncbi:MAG: ABC-2 family transporter protein [Scytolyngbya sp. HA4215-MV1]|jgi:ABC-2 type transport system permease protein|nr:ABC-2 family transporter protein [Scytolyngbya sp. HA4215-MV1]